MIALHIQFSTGVYLSWQFVENSSWKVRCRFDKQLLSAFLKLLFFHQQKYCVLFLADNLHAFAILFSCVS